MVFFFHDGGESSLQSYIPGQNSTAERNEEGIFPSDWTPSRVFGAGKHIPYVLHLIPVGKAQELFLSVIEIPAPPHPLIRVTGVVPGQRRL